MPYYSPLDTIPRLRLARGDSCLASRWSRLTAVKNANIAFNMIAQVRMNAVRSVSGRVSHPPKVHPSWEMSRGDISVGTSLWRPKIHISIMFSLPAVRSCQPHGAKKAAGWRAASATGSRISVANSNLTVSLHGNWSSGDRGVGRVRSGCIAIVSRGPLLVTHRPFLTAPTVLHPSFPDRCVILRLIQSNTFVDG